MAARYPGGVSGSTNLGIFDMDDGVGNRNLLYRRSADWAWYDGSSFTTFGGQSYLSTHRIVTVIGTSAGLTLRLNGAQVAGGPYPYTQRAWKGTISVGSYVAETNPARGFISDQLLCLRECTSQEISDMENYLNTTRSLGVL